MLRSSLPILMYLLFSLVAPLMTFSSMLKSSRDRKYAWLVLDPKIMHLVPPLVYYLLVLWCIFFSSIYFYWSSVALLCYYSFCCRAKWISYMYTYEKVQVLVAWSCPTLCDPMDHSPPGSSVHGILQARILEWLAILFPKGSSWPRYWNWVSCIAGGFFMI